MGPPMPWLAPRSTPSPEVESAAHQATSIEQTAPLVEPPRPSVEQLARGQAYRPLIGERTNVTFRTAAPMGSFEGRSGEVLGFVVVEKGCLRTDWTPATDDTGAARGVLLAGTFAVPTASFDTGIVQRNQHMASREWMDAGAHAAIIFELAAFEQPRKIRQEAGVTTFEGSLIGDLVMHGVRRPLRIDGATVAIMPEGESSSLYGPGDLLMIRCAYAVKLSDFGLDHPLIGRSVGKTVQLEQAILMTSAPLETTPEPEPEPEATEAPPQTGELMDPRNITPQH